MLIHVAVFVVSAHHKDLARVFQLKGQKETDDFKRLGAAIDIISQENVVETVNVSRVLGSLPNVEEAHQVDVVSVYVSNNFYRRLHASYEHGLRAKHLRHLVDQLNYLFAFDVEVAVGCHLLLTLLRLEQVLNEQRVK